MAVSMRVPGSMAVTLRVMLWLMLGLLTMLIIGMAPAAAQPPALRRLPPLEPIDPPVIILPTPDQPDISEELVETPPESVAAPDSVATGELWYLPSLSFDPDVWDGSFEVGLNGTEGNSTSLSLQSGVSLERKTTERELLFDLKYARTSTESVQTQHNAILKLEHNWLLADSPWSLFAKAGLAYDEFKPFDVRLTLNGGLGYDFLNDDLNKLTGRFGTGVSREFGGPDNDWTPEAVFGLDYRRQLTKRQKLVTKMDYFPDWGDFRDFRLELDAGWEILIDAEANLSLKLSVIDRYDSTPNGAKRNDVNYALLLLWKL